MGHKPKLPGFRGLVCPECQAVDCLVLWLDELDMICCAKCGATFSAGLLPASRRDLLDWLAQAPPNQQSPKPSS